MENVGGNVEFEQMTLILAIILSCGFGYAYFFAPLTVCTFNGSNDV